MAASCARRTPSHAPRGAGRRGRSALLAAAAARRGRRRAPRPRARPDCGVGGWVRDVLGVERAARRGRTSARCPAAGACSRRRAGARGSCRRTGTRRRLGAYAGAAWSPRGRFVVAWRRGTLAALEPDGGVRWSLTRPSADRGGALGAGRRLPRRVRRRRRAADRQRRRHRRPAPRRRRSPASPRRGVREHARVVAFPDAAGRVRAVRRRHGSESCGAPARCERRERSPGRRAAAGCSSLTGGPARAPRRRRPRAREPARAVGHGARGPGLVARRAPASPWCGATRSTGRSEVVLLGPGRPPAARRSCFAGPGRFGTPAWSPDGRACSCPGRRPTSGSTCAPADGGRVTAVAEIARAVLTRRQSGPRFARVRCAWCCSGRVAASAGSSRRRSARSWRFAPRGAAGRPSRVLERAAPRQHGGQRLHEDREVEEDRPALEVEEVEPHEVVEVQLGAPGDLPQPVTPGSTR